MKIALFVILIIGYVVLSTGALLWCYQSIMREVPELSKQLIAGGFVIVAYAAVTLYLVVSLFD